MGQVQAEGIHFAVQLSAQTDGEITTSPDGISICGATQAVLNLFAASNRLNFHDISAEPTVRCR